MPPIVCSAQASYKKLPGLLELTDSYLQWTKAGDKAPVVKVPHAEAACEWRNTSPDATLTPGMICSRHTSRIFCAISCLSPLAQQGRCTPGSVEDRTFER